jgi:AGZA family xanthine/uracil permease-like MFS transporter
MPSVLSRVDDFFHLDEHNTSIGAELRAGLVAFLSCSYLLLLIPHMVSAHLLVSMPAHALRALLWQTCCGVAIASSLGTLLCALLTNFPIILTPGLGLTAYFTSLLLMPSPPASPSLTHALTCLFVSGVMLLLLSLLPLHLITRAVIPHSIKLAAMAGLGLLVALSALTMSGVLLALPAGGWTAGLLLSRESVMALTGLLLVSLLLARGVKGH